MSNVIQFPKTANEHLEEYQIKLWEAIKTGDIEKIGDTARQYGQAIELYEGNFMRGVK